MGESNDVVSVASTKPNFSQASSTCSSQSLRVTPSPELSFRRPSIACDGSFITCFQPTDMAGELSFRQLKCSTTMDPSASSDTALHHNWNWSTSEISPKQVHSALKPNRPSDNYYCNINGDNSSYWSGIVNLQNDHSFENSPISWLLADCGRVDKETKVHPSLYDAEVAKWFEYLHHTPFVFNLSPSEASQLEHSDDKPSAGTSSVTGGGLISSCPHDQILQASPASDMYGKTLQAIAVSSGQNSSSSLDPVKIKFQDKKVWTRNLHTTSSSSFFPLFCRCALQMVMIQSLPLFYFPFCLLNVWDWSLELMCSSNCVSKMFQLHHDYKYHSWASLCLGVSLWTHLFFIRFSQ